MKKSVLLVIGLTLAFAASACSRTAAPSPSPGGGASASPSPTGTATASPTPPGGGTPTVSPSPSPGTPGNGTGGTIDAQSIYKQNCVSCHGADLTGGVGPNLQTVGSRLSVDQITATITNGRDGMPTFKGNLKDDQIKALAQWLSGHK